MAVKRASLGSGGGLSISIGFYPPGLKQVPHAHALPSVSIVLSGRLREEADRHEAEVAEGAVCLKPEGLQHSNVYGAEGATILSLSVSEPALWAKLAPRHGWSWSVPQPARLAELLSFMRSGGMELSAGDVLVDLIAAGTSGEARVGVPPLWLRRLRARLDDNPNLALANLAEEAGVHPVYLSRAFGQWYGTSPSVYRARRRVSIAIETAIGGRRTGSDAAHKAGFADQSHMLRSVRKLTGYSLAELRALHGSTG